MKLHHLTVLPLLAGGLILVSGCVVRPDGSVALEPIVIAPPRVVVAPPPPVYVPPPPPVYVAPPPPVVEAPPPPVATVDVVPDSYVWDGYEYVGVVGDQYYYLGPGNVWLFCDPVRLDHFHAYIGIHPDWRVHMTVNARFRNDSHGHFHPAPRPEERKDKGHGHDEDHH